MYTGTFILLAFAIVAVIVLRRSVQVVGEHEVRLVERLGKYNRTMTEGLHLLIPVVEMVRASVDLRETTLALGPVTVTSKDGGSYLVTTELQSKIVDPVAAVYAVAHLGDAVQTIVHSTLKNVVGALPSNDVASSRATISEQLRQVVVEAAATWGVGVHRVEVISIERTAESRAPA